MNAIPASDTQEAGWGGGEAMPTEKSQGSDKGGSNSVAANPTGEADAPVGSTIEDVENQIALLHAKVASLDKSRATLKRAEGDVERAKKLVPTLAARLIYASFELVPRPILVGGPQTGASRAHPRSLGVSWDE